MKSSEKEARARIEMALAAIELAQTNLGSACGHLSRVCYSELHFEIVSKAYDDIKALWHKVNMKTAGRELRMDSDWERQNPES